MYIGDIMLMSKERQGEIALLVAKTLLAKYGHLVKISELIKLVSIDSGITATEAGVFLGTIASHKKELHSGGLVKRSMQDRRKTDERRLSDSDRRK